MTKVVGLTGGIGSGKSSILRLFQERGIIAYNADNEAKILMNTDHTLIAQLIAQFGENTYINGVLNRKYLAKKVFSDKKQLQLLNSIVHPAVQKHFKKFLKNIDEKFILYENAILFENGFDAICDVIITVTAPIEKKIERVMSRDNITREQVLQRMKNQWDDDIKAAKSDYIIYNDNWDMTLTQFDKIYHDLIKKFNS